MTHRAVLAFVLCVACGSRPFAIDDAGVDAAPYDATFALPDVSEAAPACRTCSLDRHTLLDCDGNVVETCTGTNGCDETTGTCQNACSVATQMKQSVGCEYYATYLDMTVAFVLDNGRCFAAFVANTWNAPAHLTIDRGVFSYDPGAYAWIPKGVGANVTYTPYDPQAGLPPGEVAIVFLGGGSGKPPYCPKASAGGTAPMVVGTGTGLSFRIGSDVPVVAYEMNPYGGGSAAITGASLLLPTSAWDTNYVANTAAANSAQSPSIAVIASEDGTQVTLLPKVPVAGGGALPAGPANTPLQFTLDRGQFAQFEQEADLAGSIISSTKPIGLMSANPCMNWPSGLPYCDHGEQMVPPIRALGSEYAAVMFRPRVPGDAAGWRLVGAVDGTTLTYVPSAPAGAPTKLAQGDVAEFTTDQPFVVKSQDDKHPFLMFTYMSGAGDNGGYGDPDHVVEVPPAQYMTDYVFFTDPTFPETNLVVVRKATAPSTFADVTLDCAGTLGGWQTVGDYQWTRVDLETGDFKSVGACSNGRHEISSKGTFGLWIWGWGTPNTTTETRWVSYGYPGGMNVQPINTVVVPITPK